MLTRRFIACAADRVMAAWPATATPHDRLAAFLRRRPFATTLSVAVAAILLTQSARAAPGASISAALAKELLAMPRDGGVNLVAGLSLALADNTSGLPGDVTVAVHATAGWQACQRVGKDCLVVLYLPGFDGSPQDSYLGGAPSLRADIDAAVARGELPPLIVIVADPKTPLGGSFYVNSPANGKWSNYLAYELVPAVEEALKVADAGQRRVVMGHSMGGFGALHLGLQDVTHWHGVAALSPVASTRFAEGAPLAAALRAAAKSYAPTTVNSTAWRSRAFTERLFWAMASAWTNGKQVRWQYALSSSPHPALLRAYAKNWLAFDPVARIRADKAASVCKLRRLVLRVGRRDAVVPVAHVQELAEIIDRGCGAHSPAILTVHDGGHGNLLRADAVAALGLIWAHGGRNGSTAPATPDSQMPVSAPSPK